MWQTAGWVSHLVSELKYAFEILAHIDPKCLPPICLLRKSELLAATPEDQAVRRIQWQEGEEEEVKNGI